MCWAIAASPWVVRKEVSPAERSEGGLAEARVD